MSLILTDNRPFDPDKCLPWKGMKRCALRQDGTVYKYHHPEDTNKWEDGSNVDWNQYEKDGLNCMLEIPKFYYAKYPYNMDGTYEQGHIWVVSDTLEEGFELHPAFYRCRDKSCDDSTGIAKEVDYRYRAAFLGWKDNNNMLRSLPNKLPLTNIKIADSRNYAKKNGFGWGILDYNLFYACQLLFAVEYGNYDSQTILGKGYVDGNSDKTNTGATLSKGNYSYGETTGKKQMSYRGIEDMWGNCLYWLDGFFCDNNMNIKIGNKCFNDSGNGYKTYGTSLSEGVAGYISDIYSDKNFGFVIKSGGASNISKFYNYGGLYKNSLPYAGGAWSSGPNIGAFYFYCGTSNSSISSQVGCSIVF